MCFPMDSFNKLEGLQTRKVLSKKSYDFAKRVLHKSERDNSWLGQSS